MHSWQGLKAVSFAALPSAEAFLIVVIVTGLLALLTFISFAGLQAVRRRARKGAVNYARGDIHPPLLPGRRYHRVSPITAYPQPERAASQRVRERLAHRYYDAEEITAKHAEILKQLRETPFRKLGQKLVKGDPLTFDEAFLGMTFVLCATNRAIFRELRADLEHAHGVRAIVQHELLAPAQTFLTVMAQREAFEALVAEEIAGIVAAARMDLVLPLSFEPYILETGGMGGDRGFVVDGRRMKPLNTSTLTALVLSALGVMSMKHGSYGNTSPVGSTDAMQGFGGCIFQSSFPQIQHLFEATSFYFNDAHIAKTLHDLSHSRFMRHETFNHVIGPMTPPVATKSLMHKIIGVNEGVHPNLIAEAYALLHRRGYQTVGNVAVVSGLSDSFPGDIDVEDHRQTKPYMMLDEVSPYATLLSVMQNGQRSGCFIVRPEDFGATLVPHAIQTEDNRPAMLAANRAAIDGTNEAKRDYLAVGAALGLFVVEYLGRDDAIVNGHLNRTYLQICFQRCRDALASGAVAAHVQHIVAISRATCERKYIGG